MERFIGSLLSMVIAILFTLGWVWGVYTLFGLTPLGYTVLFVSGGVIFVLTYPLERWIKRHLPEEKA